MGEYLGKFYTNKKGQFCDRCPLYAVVVDAIGRFDHVDKLKTPPEQRHDTGFGHMNGYESQLVLQSVTDVTAQPIDPAIYEE
jgi:hypothetical protein